MVMKVKIVGSGRSLFCTCTRGPSGTVRDGFVDPYCMADSFEVLFDGPAGSGKTFTDCYRIHQFCLQYPGVRVVGFRETLKSMRQSIQVTFTDQILRQDDRWGPAIIGRDSSTRTQFDYPNGSVFVMQGTDRPGLLQSTEWDMAVVFEATNPRIRESFRNILRTRMRNTGIPHPHCEYPDGLLPDGRKIADMLVFHKNELCAIAGEQARDGYDRYGVPFFFRQIVYECNPDYIMGEEHWLWRAKMRGDIHRLQSTHDDNPRKDESYLETLRNQPSPYREAFYEGRWVSLGGRVWGTYKPELHLVSGAYEFKLDTGKRFITVNDWQDERGMPRIMEVARVVAGYDWGMASPGSLQVFAVTMDGIAFRIAEIYRAGEELPWWADRVVELQQTYHIDTICCDPNAEGTWDFFNMHLNRDGRKVGPIAKPANNVRQSRDGKQGGLDLVRSMFSANKLFLFDECHIGPVDTKLLQRHQPTGWAEEIPAYVLARDQNDLSHVLNTPDDKCVDHGCDSARYALCEIFSTEGSRRQVAPLTTKRSPWLVPTLAEHEVERYRNTMAPRKLSVDSFRPRNWR